ncbi:MAG: phosphoribosylglycinamide formyltransferase [Candidatus Hydrogenedentes bacterium]|jgi:phosphoribosylglycinamide formyltransferase-1|nr:phosphoribosylglycinamide formyltransferase [Candidatus Hydrogenedentota bacterium]
MAINIAVLLSGNGTTLQNILDRSAAGTLDARVSCVISTREKAFGLERARKAGVPAAAVPRKSFDATGPFSETVWAEINKYPVDLVVLAGFMSMLDVPAEFENRIMNVHAALIPAFCGKGMYGAHVYEAVLDAGVKVTGVTVHFVDAEYDHGPIILQRPVAVAEDDTPDTLAARVQAEEREAYPEAIQLYAEGRLKVVDGRVRVAP